MEAAIWTARAVLLAASLLVLADAAYRLARDPTEDERRRKYYHRD